MTELVFLLEEPSARAMLEGLLPRIVTGVTTRFIVFKGKQDLQRQLLLKLRHYQSLNARFVVLCDQDSADCKALKSDLHGLCQNAGKADALVRIVCHELENWYLADLNAVEIGLGVRGLAAQQQTRKFREPDRIANAPQELARLVGGEYQKIRGSRLVGPHLDVNNHRSRSFAVFVAGIKKLTAAI